MEHTPAVGGTDTLVDIRDVTVDRELSREDRIAEFVRQIKNPYRFKCGQFTVHASFASGGATLEECARVLRDSGAASVLCLTAARTPRTKKQEPPEDGGARPLC